MNSIYHITQEQLHLNYLLEESGGEVTPEIEQALAISEEQMLVKAEDYIEAIKAAEAMATVADMRIKELQAVKQRQKRKVELMKQALSTAMGAFGYDRLEVGLSTLSFRKSKSVEIVDETKIPNRFIKVETHIDKLALSKELKSGIEIEGAQLVESRNIQIR